MQRAFARATAEMLADDDNGPLAEVAIGRRFVVEATRSFDLSVARARAAGFWEQIAERVPGYTRVYGAEAAEVAEVAFNEVAVPRSGPDEHYVSWRCGDCEGLVLDRGPYGDHPIDAEPGHRTGWERLIETSPPTSPTCWPSTRLTPASPKMLATASTRGRLPPGPCTSTGRAWSCDA
jgi:hypothetical protein